MIQKLIVSIALAIAFSPLAAGQHPQSAPPAFLLRIGEANVELSRHGIIAGDCLLVLPDGHFHLERRKQQLPNRRAKLRIFESSLSTSQLQQLREILDGEAIEKLPLYTPPVYPMAVPWSDTFIAEMARQAKVQKVGYVVWRGGTAPGSPNSTPDSVKQEWRDSETALKPLVDWFHGWEATKLPKHGKSTLCRLPGEPEDGDSN